MNLKLLLAKLINQIHTQSLRLVSNTGSASVAANSSGTVKVTLSLPTGFSILGVVGWQVTSKKSDGTALISTRMTGMTWSGNVVSVGVTNTSTEYKQTVTVKIKAIAVHSSYS